MAKDLKSIKGKSQDEELTNRILIAFGMSLVGLLAVILIGRQLDDVYKFVPTVLACGYAAIAFAVASVVFVTVAVTGRKKNPENIWNGRFVQFAVLSCIAALSLTAIRLFPTESFGVLYAALPSLAFVYLIFKIYQKDFFAQTMFIGLGGITLFILSRLNDVSPLPMLSYVVSGAAVLALVICLIMLTTLPKKEGKIGKTVLFSKKANYKLMYTTIAIMIACIIVAMVLGSVVAFWLMIGAFAYLFVLAVYYTIKLM